MKIDQIFVGTLCFFGEAASVSDFPVLKTNKVKLLLV